MTTSTVTDLLQQWIDAYEARMRERGYPKDRIHAALRRVTIDLAESPKDAADDEMYEWENE